MAITVLNVSYITDSDELFQFTDENRIRELIYVDTPSEDPMEATIADAMFDKLHRAMNWGRAQIDTFLRNLYNVSLAKGLVVAVDASTPGEVVKVRNVRLCEYMLSRKRFSLEDDMRIWRYLKDDMKDLARADADEILGDAQRDSQILPVGTANLKPIRARDQVSIFDAVDGAPWNLPMYTEESGSE